MDEPEFHPLSVARWADLAAFFAQNGNPNYCWCMRWRLKSADFTGITGSKSRCKITASHLIPSGSLEDASEGGLGIHLIRTYTDECRYRREDHKNILTMVLKTLTDVSKKA